MALIVLQHYCRQKRIKESEHPFSSCTTVLPFCSDCRLSAGYLSQRELFDLLVSAKVSTVEAKALIVALDPLVQYSLSLCHAFSILLLPIMPNFRFSYFSKASSYDIAEFEQNRLSQVP